MSFEKTAFNMGNTISLKSAAEAEIMFEANQIVADTLNMLKGKIDIGITTLQLDQWAEDFCRKAGSKPAFKDIVVSPVAFVCRLMNKLFMEYLRRKRF